MGKADVSQRMRGEFSKRISLALKDLVENKHLYQSVSLECDDLTDLGNELDSQIRGLVRMEFSQSVKGPWAPSAPANTPRLIAGAQDSHNTSPSGIWFRPSDVKLFCSTCKRLEAFNLVSCRDFLTNELGLAGSFRIRGNSVQAFVISFLCQSCKSVPEVFMVRRQGLKLTLCGRAPMAHLDVPAVVPKSVRSFYSGAVLAHQSGQTLAGNFMLRTVIEQWARIATGQVRVALADQVLDAYMITLPDDFKGRFPSMRNLYGELSVDIHGAVGSPELFEKARNEITEHFDARRLFKLAEPPAPNASHQADG